MKLLITSSGLVDECRRKNPLKIVLISSEPQDTSYSDHTCVSLNNKERMPMTVFPPCYERARINCYQMKRDFVHQNSQHYGE